MNIQKVLKLADKYLFLGLVFLFPLVFLPIFANAFDTAKLLILFVGVLLISAVKIIKYFLEGGFEFKIGKLDIYVVLFAFVYILSTIVVSPSKVDALFLPGSALFVILGSLLYFFGNQLSEKDKGLTETALILSAVTASLIQFASMSGLILKNFLVFGSILNSIVFLSVVATLAVVKVLRGNNNITHRITYGVFGFIILVALSLNLFAVLPGKATAIKLLDIKSGWSIAIDTIKQSPLLGFGPSNFNEAFSKLKPITFNSTANWSDRFLVSTNTLLTILSEVGIIGLLLFVVIFVKSANKDNLKKSTYFSVLVIIALSIILPIPASMLPIVFLFLSLNGSTNMSFGRFSSKLPMILLSLPIISLALVSAFFGYRAFMGEYYFSKAIIAINSNDGLKAYDSLNKSISINPYIDRYHQAAADINIAIANNLAQKEELTDEEKTTISQLIQQTIAEGKASVSANKNKAGNWEKLGDVYSQITAYAKDANNFALQSYNQAIFLDPINPITRIKLGGVYFADGKFEDAVKVFELAVLAKPDYANSHFNLAMAYKSNKQIDKAKEQMTLVLQLVEKDSKDYELAKSELEKMDEKVVEKPTEEETLPAPTEELTTPPAQPSEPVIDPQVQIPQE